MNLETRQRAFQTQILADDALQVSDWDDRMAAGLAIYRNAYRARLLATLAETYTRVQKWVGAQPFEAASAHHLICHPPRSWTLDDAGRGFAATLAELFPSDPEVEELAWLEWSMHRSFVAGDEDVIDAAQFSRESARFDDEDWHAMRLRFLACVRTRPIRTNCADLWQTLGSDSAEPGFAILDKPAILAVWREGFSSVFRVFDSVEAEGLDLMRGGASYGELCAWLVAEYGEDAGVTRAGGWLGRWIVDGLVAGLAWPDA